MFGVQAFETAVSRFYEPALAVTIFFLPSFFSEFLVGFDALDGILYPRVIIQTKMPFEVPKNSTKLRFNFLLDFDNSEYAEFNLRKT